MTSQQQESCYSTTSSSYNSDEAYFTNHYYQYERVPFQLQPSTLPSLRELFFNTELSMPEFAGFMSGIQQQRLIVEQLRREAAVKRINVSQAVEDIKRYVTEHQREDCLIHGFHPPKNNPFREKTNCTLL